MAQSPPIAAVVDGDDVVWAKKARERHDLLLNLKPERSAEIEAVAPRLHLAPKVVQKLVRWSDLVADLAAAGYSSATDRHDFERAEKREVVIAQAYHRAEIKLLQGLDNWNRYYRLKGFSMTGLLHTVDDNGDPLHWGPYSREPLYKRPSHPGPPPAPLDTSEFDHYFAD